MNEKEQKETRAEEERIRENGQVTLEENGKRIHLLSIIGEIEGHDNLSGSTKTTKYEHILPELAKVESDEKIGGVLILVNTIGGDVSCGLALAEMIASGVTTTATGAATIAGAVIDYNISSSQADSKELEAILERLRQAIKMDQDLVEAEMERANDLMTQVREIVGECAETQSAILGVAPTMA